MSNRKERIRVQIAYMALCRRVLETVGIDVKEAASEAGLSRQTIYAWATGRYPMPDGVALRRWHTYMNATLKARRDMAFREYSLIKQETVEMATALDEGYRRVGEAAKAERGNNDGKP